MDRRLLEAAREGDTDKLQMLLSEESYIIERSCLNESAETILHVAALAGRTEFMEKVLEKKPDLAKRLNQDGYGAIHLASANGFVEIVRILLKFDPQLGRLKSSDGRTALHFAAKNGSISIIKELMELCPSCKDDLTPRGETALHLAVKNGQFEAFKVVVGILQHHNLKELLNVEDNDGNTVLHHATAKGQILILKFLLDGQDIEKGIINVNAVNKSGLTALDTLDFAQQMVADRADYTLRVLFQNAAASRAKELGSGIDIDVITEDPDVTIRQDQADSSRQQPESALSKCFHFFVREIAEQNPIRYYKRLAKEVKKTSAETQNALMVVAVLIATVTYQGILNPPNGSYSDGHSSSANIAGTPLEFIIFMVPNSIGFFASIAVILLLIHRFPLASLLGLAARCMAASYICGVLLIGPTSLSASHSGLLAIGGVISVDLVRFTYPFCLKLSRKITKRE